jgi:hypothetical protein
MKNQHKTIIRAVIYEQDKYRWDKGSILLNLSFQKYIWDWATKKEEEEEEKGG